MRQRLGLVLGVPLLLALVACAGTGASPTPAASLATVAPTTAATATRPASAAPAAATATRVGTPTTLAAPATATRAGTPAAARPTLIVTPAAGPVGTLFAVRGVEFPPATLLTGAVIDPAGVRHPMVIAHGGRADNRSEVNGTFVFADSWLAEAGEPAGVYTVTVAAASAPDVALATATFTVTAP